MNTVNAYVMEYLEYCEYRKRLERKTLKAYQIDLKQYLNYLSVPSDFDSKNLLDQYITYLHKIYKPKTIPFHSIQVFLSALYAEKERASSEYQRRCCIRDIAVIELLFATGMRISELCSLKPSDIDFENNSILIYGKGAKERILQIGNPEVLSALLLYERTFQEDIASCGYFFVNKRKQKLSDQSVRFMINRYAKLADLEQHLTPHMFRHSFATLLLEQDVDIRYIQRMLGHSSISTTEIYTHVSNVKQRDILFHRHPRNFMRVNGG